MKNWGSSETEPTHVGLATILLADGDAEFLEDLTMGLELTWPLATVVVARDGEFAVKQVEQGFPAIALIELALTAEDGYSALARIRSFSDVPIIIMSADDNEANIVRAFETGADDFIAKPFGSLELLARMRSLLRRSGVAQGFFSEPPLSIGDIVVHFSQRRVDVSGVTVRLTCTEHSIVTMLARDLGHCVSHRQLGAAAWGSTRCNCHDRLKACVWRLRKKIEPTPKDPVYLLSVHGVGYVLVDPGHDIPVRQSLEPIHGGAQR